MESYLNAIDYTIILLYLVVLILLGFRLRQRASAGLEPYLLGNRSMPWWMLGIAGVMDFWDLAGTMIIVSYLFLLGPRGLFIEFRGGAVLVLAVAMLWTGKWHRRSGCLTSAEWMLFRFGDGLPGRMAQFARALTGIVVTIGLIAYLVKGTGLFLSVFVPFTPAECSLVLLASATVYSMLSGFYGVVLSHMLQFAIVLLAAVAIIALSYQHNTSLETLTQMASAVTGNSAWSETVPAMHVSMPRGYEAYESMILLASLYLLRNVLFGMGAGDDPKYFASRSDADCGKLTLLWTTAMALRWPMMMALAVLGISVMYQLFPNQGAAEQVVALIRSDHPLGDWDTVTSAIASSPELQSPELVSSLQRLLGDDWPTRLQLIGPFGTINPERVMPAVMLYAIPPGLRSLLVVSLIASAMAGFGAWTNQSSGFFTHDIYQKHIRPSASVPELMLVTWMFIMAIALAGYAFAYSVPSINNVWGWIIMGLGSGMMFPQMLPLYWSRINGVGYTVGMLTGVATAVVIRIVGPRLGSDWSFLNEERWLLPIIGLLGLVSSILASLVSRPTPEPVLQRFFNRTLPFGFWGRFRKALPEELNRQVAAEHKREILALPFALLYQTMIFLTPMLLIIRSWQSAAICFSITVLAYAMLHFLWLRRIDESDVIAAEARNLTIE